MLWISTALMLLSKKQKAPHEGSTACKKAYCWMDTVGAHSVRPAGFAGYSPESSANTLHSAARAINDRPYDP